MVAPNAFEQKVRAHRSCEDAIPGPISRMTGRPGARLHLRVVCRKIGAHHREIEGRQPMCFVLDPEELRPLAGLCSEGYAAGKIHCPGSKRRGSLAGSAGICSAWSSIW